MNEIFLKRLAMNKDIPDISIKEPSGRTRKIDLSDTKSEFLSRTPFAQGVLAQFRSGYASAIAQGVALEYSYEDILNFSAKTAGCALCETLGDDREIIEKYHIGLSLDSGQSANKSELFFQIIERNGTDNLSKISFSLKV